MEAKIIIIGNSVEAIRLAEKIREVTESQVPIILVANAFSMSFDPAESLANVAKQAVSAFESFGAAARLALPQKKARPHYDRRGNWKGGKL